MDLKKMTGFWEQEDQVLVMHSHSNTSRACECWTVLSCLSPDGSILIGKSSEIRIAEMI